MKTVFELMKLHGIDKDLVCDGEECGKPFDLKYAKGVTGDADKLYYTCPFCGWMNVMSREVVLKSIKTHFA